MSRGKEYVATNSVGTSSTHSSRITSRASAPASHLYLGSREDLAAGAHRPSIHNVPTVPSRLHLADELLDRVFTDSLVRHPQSVWRDRGVSNPEIFHLVRSDGRLFVERPEARYSSDRYTTDSAEPFRSHYMHEDPMSHSDTALANIKQDALKMQNMYSSRLQTHKPTGHMLREFPMMTPVPEDAMAPEFEQCAEDVYAAWHNAQTHIDPASQEYNAFFKDAMYWKFFKMSYTSLNSALLNKGDDSVDKKFIEDAKLFANIAITLMEDVWYAYHLLYRVYCAIGDGSRANEAMRQVENILKKNGEFDVLVNICYAPKIYQKLKANDPKGAEVELQDVLKKIERHNSGEQGNSTFSKPSAVDDSGVGNSPVVGRKFNQPSLPITLVTEHLQKLRDSQMRHDPVKEDSNEEDPYSVITNHIRHNDSSVMNNSPLPAQSAGSLATTFVKACETFVDTLATECMKRTSSNVTKRIESVEDQMEDTRAQVGGLEIKIMTIEITLKKALEEQKISMNNLDIEEKLLHINSGINHDVIQYAKAFVYTIMKTHTAAMVILGTGIKLDTSSIADCAITTLLGLIPLCGSTVASITGTAVEIIQEHNIRENAAKIIKIAPSSDEMNKICQELLGVIANDAFKCAEIISAPKVEKVGLFRKFLDKVKTISKKIEGGNLYTTDVMRLAYQDAHDAINKCIIDRGSADGFSSVKDVVQWMTESVLGHPLMLVQEHAAASDELHVPDIANDHGRATTEVTGHCHETTV